MKTSLFVRRVHIDAPAEDVFAWHARPGAFERLLPPWEEAEIIRRTDGILNGAETEVIIPIGPVRRHWVARHSGYVEGRQFRDTQIVGPFTKWEHLHCIEPDGPRACYLEDRVEYVSPGGLPGRLLTSRIIHKRLNRLFDYRHTTTRDDVLTHVRYQGNPPLKVLISGPSGLLGRNLIPFLTTGGHSVVKLVRSAGSADASSVFWNPIESRIEAERLEGIDALVHLAGENLAAGRWTSERKQRMYQSRVHSTRFLCETMARLPNPPKVIVCASAVGFYGNRGDTKMTEHEPAGTGFLAGLTRDWENAVQPAIQRGIRVVQLRLGIVLTPGGGALAKMLTPFKTGLGGVVGNGRQYLSWISIDDALAVIHRALIDTSFAGPINAVAPEAATNREFTKTLGKVLERPTIFPIPAGFARIALGEMANETLLSSCRAVPARLQASGYAFRHPDLEGALRHLLGRMDQVIR